MTREQLASLEPLEIIALSHRENPDLEKAYLTAISALFRLGYAQAALDLQHACFIMFGDPRVPPPVGILNFRHSVAVSENEALIVNPDGKSAVLLTDLEDGKG